VLRRRPRLWWVLSLALALAAAAAAASAVSGAEAARARWGRSVAVVVATRDIEPGDPLAGAGLVLERRPRSTVPASALTRIPPDAVAGSAIVDGEVLVAERLAGEGLRGAAARLPRGTRAMAIPAEPGLTPPLDVGDVVDVVVAVPTDEAGSGPPGFTLVTGALVVAVSEDATTIAVPRDDVPRVAVALGAGAVTLALVGAG
jgi:Flp pilus assembly protein CpaB